MDCRWIMTAAHAPRTSGHFTLGPSSHHVISLWCTAHSLWTVSISCATLRAPIQQWRALVAILYPCMWLNKTCLMKVAWNTWRVFSNLSSACFRAVQQMVLSGSRAAPPCAATSLRNWTLIRFNIRDMVEEISQYKNNDYVLQLKAQAALTLTHWTPALSCVYVCV